MDHKDYEALKETLGPNNLAPCHADGIEIVPHVADGEETESISITHRRNSGGMTTPSALILDRLSRGGFLSKPETEPADTETEQDVSARLRIMAIHPGELVLRDVNYQSPETEQ